jgi:uncharacterized protein with PQ loop repeat
MHPNDILGLGAVAATSVQFLPQVVRLVRLRRTAGISAWFWIFVAIQSLLWIGYAVSHGLVFVGGVNAIVLSASIVVIACLALYGRRHFVGALLTGISLMAVALVFVAVAPSRITGLLAAALAGLAWLPQAWEAIVDRDLSGLSPSSWVLTLLSSTLWGLHGLFIPDPLVVLPAAMGGITSLIVLRRIYRAASEP